MQISNIPPGFSAPGFHVARCCGIIQIGTIFLYEHWKQMVRLEWELPLEVRPFKTGQPEQPKILSREYTASLYGESHLRKHLTSWFGADFVSEFERTLDMSMILGAPCILEVLHKQDPKTGKWFEEVGQVHGTRPGDDVPESINKPRILELTEEGFDRKLFDSLPAFLQIKISKSQEFQKLFSAA